MDRNSFQGTNFSAIFWTAMRTVFKDENGNNGALYDGRVFPESQAAVTRNGRRFGFDESQQSVMLRDGEFWYRRTGGSFPLPALRFEGPDLPDDQGAWAAAPVPGFLIRINFYNMITFGNANFGSGATAIDRMIWFTGGIVLHEIMHNNGFSHPDVVNWTPGSDYASSLPHVALQSVLRVSPHHSFFDGLIDIERMSLQSFTFRQIFDEPNVDERTSTAANLLQETVKKYSVAEAAIKRA
jgi:hypothetical protein